MNTIRRVRAVVEYDGARFSGFQRQADVRTVQGALEEAIVASTGVRATVKGAGRTDAGVHAVGQVVSFLTPTRMSDARLQRAINAHLPVDVVVTEIMTVSTDFDPQRDAITRVYEYRIDQRPTRPVLGRWRSWHLIQPLDLERMRRVAKCFVGTHDFFAFTTGQQGNTQREVQAVEIWTEGSLVFIRISARAFLYRMVRRIVATLVRAGQDGLEAGEVEDILRLRLRERVMGTAPAHGLTLIQVMYSDHDYRYNEVFKEEVVV